MNTINERIAQCIETTGLTKTAFARKINLSQPHISKIALGYTDPTDRTIADICREFNVNETWLRTGEGEMFNTSSDTLVNKLAKEYGLDDLGSQIMSAYLELGESDRLAVGRLIQNIMNRTPILATNSKPEAPAPVVDSKTETTTQAAPDLAAKVAELERQNEEKDRRLQELSARLSAMEEEDELFWHPDTGNLA